MSHPLEDLLVLVAWLRSHSLDALLVKTLPAIIKLFCISPQPLFRVICPAPRDNLMKFRKKWLTIETLIYLKITSFNKHFREMKEINDYGL